MKSFTKGVNYLKRIEQVSLYKSIYECKVCGGSKVIYDSKVSSGHDKTCGCMNGKRSIRYEITRDGHAVSKTGMYLESNSAKGYKSFRGEFMHRLVAKKFIPNPNGYSDVNHIDGNKHNNSVDNLEWCTRSHNIQHAYDNGLNSGPAGVKSANRKLSDADVIGIRKSNLTTRELASVYNISKVSVRNILHRRTYKEIK